MQAASNKNAFYNRTCQDEPWESLELLLSGWPLALAFFFFFYIGLLGFAACLLQGSPPCSLLL